MMTTKINITATTIVAADTPTAFEIFTTEVDSWWKRGARFRPAVQGGGVLQFEPQVGGRLLETYSDDSVFEFGRVTTWEPGERLGFTLIGRDFGINESTEVEVRFEAEGENTRVTVEHRGWEAFPPEHPARHGLEDEAFSDVMSLWWADLLVAIQNYSANNSEN